MMGAKSFLSNKFVQYALLAGLVAILFIVGFNLVKGAFNDYEKDLRADIENEYTIKDLKKSLEQAEKDKQFEKEQREKAQQEVAEWRDTVSTISQNVGSSKIVIRDRIASGDLEDREIAPVIDATIDAVQSLKEKQFGAQK